MNTFWRGLLWLGAVGNLGIVGLYASLAFGYNDVPLWLIIFGMAAHAILSTWCAGVALGFREVMDGWEWESATGRHWWRIEPICEWPKWLPGAKSRVMWCDFTPVFLRITNDWSAASWEATAILLGLGVHIRYTDELVAQVSPAHTMFEEWVEDEWEVEP